MDQNRKSLFAVLSVIVTLLSCLSFGILAFRYDVTGYFFGPAIASFLLSPLIILNIIFSILSIRAKEPFQNAAIVSLIVGALIPIGIIVLTLGITFLGLEAIQ